MSELFSSLEWADGQTNPSGIKTTVYIVLKRWIKTWPKPATAPAKVAQLVQYVGDFELQDGKTFLKLYTTQGAGSATFEPSGEKDHQMFTNKAVFSFPDISDAAKGNAVQILNSNVVFVVALPHPSEKRYVVIGSEDYDVTVKISGTSGDKPGSNKGLTFNVEAPDALCLPSYQGVVVLEDGSLNCATGVFTETTTVG
jgi:hypothetical protein